MLKKLLKLCSKDANFIIGYLLLSTLIIAAWKYLPDDIFFELMFFVVTIFLYINFLKRVSTNLKDGCLRANGLIDLVKIEGKYLNYYLLLFFISIVHLPIVIQFIFNDLAERTSLLNALFDNSGVINSVLSIIAFIWTVVVKMALLLSFTRVAYYKTDIIDSFIGALKDMKNLVLLLMFLTTLHIFYEILNFYTITYSVQISDILEVFVFALLTVTVLMKYGGSFHELTDLRLVAQYLAPTTTASK